MRIVNLMWWIAWTPTNRGECTREANRGKCTWEVHDGQGGHEDEKVTPHLPHLHDHRTKTAGVEEKMFQLHVDS